MARHILTDAQWEAVKDLVPGNARNAGRTGVDNRRSLDGMLWVLRTGAAFATGLRGGGSADLSACRTVRRCTRWRSARPRMETPSSRRSRRICSNSFTFDTPWSFAAGKSRSPERSHWIGRGWGHFRSSLGLQAGPAQTVTPTGQQLGDRSPPRLLREGALDEVGPDVIGAARAFLAGG